MDAHANTMDLRKASASELERLGQESLRAHLIAQAVVAHQKHGPVTSETLEGLLHDPECLRHPVRLVFEFGEMSMHQFAQPDIDWRNTGRTADLSPQQLPETSCSPFPGTADSCALLRNEFRGPGHQDGRVLYVRPMLRDRPDLLPLAIAYMIPVINYGQIISDEHCLLYGATLLGMMEDEYYARLCRMAELLGAETRLPGEMTGCCG